VIVAETRLDDGMLTVGLLADSVSSVIDIASDAIEPPPPFGTNIRVDFLTGMGKLEGRLVLILDLDRILSPIELEQIAV
jgi:purine-binding chemotaxis protein CheW